MTHTTTKRLCGQCGARAVLGRAQAGRTAIYKNLTLKIPAHVVVPTCGRCGAEWIDEPTARTLDDALEGAYQDALRERLDAALKIISGQEGNQSRVERLLGVSPGYLSKLKRGRRQPSAEIVSMLALVSKSPKRRLAELERFYHPEPARKRAAG
jgi:DNA-binding transcriptional regulator YiaG/ribosomal protein L40E